MTHYSEAERMIAGELYRASDSALVAARRRASRLCRLYNESTEDDPRARLRLLEELFGAVGPRVEIEPPFHCDYGSNIRAGDGLYMNFGCVLLDCAPITIGAGADRTGRAHLCRNAPGGPLDPGIRPRACRAGDDREQRVDRRGSIVCPGVRIGDDSVIGAGSVVTRDVPRGVVATGNPCRVIRRLPGDEVTACSTAHRTGRRHAGMARPAGANGPARPLPSAAPLRASRKARS
jgi:maltose O-acetyltransferase